MRLRKAFLWSMIGSLSLAAMLGIVALLLPDLLGKDEEILVSTLLFAVYSLLALCCAIVAEKRRLVTLMWIGIASSGISVLIWLALIWFDSTWCWEDGGSFAKTAITFTTAAIVIALCGLLVLPRLDGFSAKSLRMSTIGATVLFGVFLVVFFWWFEWIDQYIDDELIARGMGVLAILSACGTVITPIIWKVQAVHRVESAVSIPSRLHIDIKCPRCQTQQELSAGPSKCAHCGLRITIDVEEPRCTCGYQLYRLESERCPECGREIPEADHWAAGQSDDPSRTTT